MSNFATSYSNPYKEIKYNCGERSVNTLGYVPMKERLITLIESGAKLTAFREEQYDADFRVRPEEIQASPFRDRGLTKMDYIDRAKQVKAYLEDVQKKSYETRMAKIKAQQEREKLSEKQLDPTVARSTNATNDSGKEVT